MPRRTTIENRVYIFTPLAAALVQGLAEDLAAPGRRERALEVLAELARVSCIFADSEELSPDEVRERLLRRPQPEGKAEGRPTRRRGAPL